MKSVLPQVDRIDAVRIILKILPFLGLWPWQLEKNRSIFNIIARYYHFMVHIPLTFTFILLMWIEALVSQNMEEAGQVLYMSITEIALIIKIINIWYRHQDAWQFIHELCYDADYQLITNEECILWQKEQTFFKRLFFIYILISLGVAFSSFVGTLLDDVYALPFPYYVAFEWRNSEHFWYAYIYDVVGTLSTCISNTTLDFIGCYFLFHISLLYRLMGMRLAAMKTHKNQQTIQEFHYIFVLHRKVRILTKKCETILSPFILSQIILSAFIICFSGYRMQRLPIKDEPAQFIAMLQFVSVMILQIYFPCYYSNEVTFYSNKLTNQVYNMNWLQCSADTRRILNIYMELLKRPVRIKVANLFEVGLPIFVRTMNNSYTFLALLLNISK